MGVIHNSFNEDRKRSGVIYTNNKKLLYSFISTMSSHLAYHFTFPKSFLQSYSAPIQCRLVSPYLYVRLIDGKELLLWFALAENTYRPKSPFIYNPNYRMLSSFHLYLVYSLERHRMYVRWFSEQVWKMLMIAPLGIPSVKGQCQIPYVNAKGSILRLLHVVPNGLPPLHLHKRDSLEIQQSCLFLRKYQFSPRC